MHLEWKPTALTEKENIIDYISLDNPQAATAVDDELEIVAEPVYGSCKCSTLRV